MEDPAEAAWRRLYQKEWRLPGVSLLDPASESAEAGLHDHERNVRIIEEKLRSFQIPATVVATNTGPVVTQYEVRPDARIKISRIEGLADDLAMALAARSIRIEAPIPGVTWSASRSPTTRRRWSASARSTWTPTWPPPRAR